MNITLNPKDINYIIRNYFKEKHNLCLDEVSFPSDFSEITLKGIPEKDFVLHLPNDRKTIIDDALKSLINDGKFIDAIKHLRAQIGCGLKEAKDYIDYYRDNKTFPSELP